MRALVAVLLAVSLAAPLPASAAPDRSREIEAKFAKLEAQQAQLLATIKRLESQLVPQPAPPSVASSQPTLAPSRAPWGLMHRGLMFLGGPLMVGGAPIVFAYPGGGSSGGGSGVALGDTPTWTGAHTFSADVTFNGGTGAIGFGAGETIVPADGTLNVTGAFAASTTITATTSILADTVTPLSPTGGNLVLGPDGGTLTLNDNGNGVYNGSSFRLSAGGFGANVSAVKTTDYVVLLSDHLVLADVATTGDVAVTLPDCSYIGQEVLVKATTLHVTRDVNINRAGSDTITTMAATAATTLQLSPSVTYSAVTLVCDGGTVWYVVNLEP